MSVAEDIVPSVEAKWLGIAAVAPIAWGTGYYVTDTYLPPGRPLFGAAVRALPFGLMLLALRPGLLSGSWWWRTVLLGALNFSAFFFLIFVASYRLPGGLASTITATAPIAVMLLAWVLAGERPHRASLAAAVVGVGGVALLVVRGSGAVDALGVLASLAAVAVSSLGFVLVKTWRPPVELATFTAWQLVFGGLLLAPVALLVEGVPPALDARAVVGFGYLGLVGTVAAYASWFAAMRRLPAAAVSLVGLLNPVTGTVVGVGLADETLGVVQLAGLVLVLGGALLGQPAVIEAVRRATRPARPVTASTASEDRSPCARGAA
jgi:probable blue pigment (indigoidine) exporter